MNREELAESRETPPGGKHRSASRCQGAVSTIVLNGKTMAPFLGILLYNIKSADFLKASHT